MFKLGAQYGHTVATFASAVNALWVCLPCVLYCELLLRPARSQGLAIAEAYPELVGTAKRRAGFYA